MTYPKGYKPLPVREQTKILCEYFGIDVPSMLPFKNIKVHPESDGLYVIPKPSFVAKHLRVRPQDPYKNWGRLTEDGPLAALESQGNFKNWRKGEMTNKYIKLLDSTKKALQQLEEDQEGDFLVISAQTGKKHTGKSVQDVRNSLNDGKEWLLPAYCVGWMLFTNPHRLTAWEDLAIDCAGDEYSYGADDEFGYCLYFNWYEDEVHVDGSWVEYARESFGSASAFGSHLESCNLDIEGTRSDIGDNKQNELRNLLDKVYRKGYDKCIEDIKEFLENHE